MQLSSTRIGFSEAERQEFAELDRRMRDALGAVAATETRDEQEHLASIVWATIKTPTRRVPDEAPAQVRRLSVFLARRAARRGQEGHRRRPAVMIPRARAREHRPAESRRASSSSTTSSADPGDPEPEPAFEPWTPPAQLALRIGGPPSADRLRELIGPYRERCPIETCGAPLRVLGTPPRYVGCGHCSALTDLAGLAVTS